MTLKPLPRSAFMRSLLFAMLPALVLKKGFLSQEFLKLKSLDEVYLPFVIDSDQNVELDTIFMKESKITKYLCAGCKKHAVWVGECGNMNHNYTIAQYVRKYGREPKCPLCHTTIGHEGYNKPVNLIRLNKKPIRKE